MMDHLILIELHEKHIIVLYSRLTSMTWNDHENILSPSPYKIGSRYKIYVLQEFISTYRKQEAC